MRERVLFKETNSQPTDKDVHREVKGNAEGPLMKVIKSGLRNIRNRGDTSDYTIDHIFCE